MQEPIEPGTRKTIWIELWALALKKMFQNYPLSWTEASENGTIEGRGVAFILVNILREKFNFTFEVVVPERNFELGGRRSEESLIGLVNSSVC